MKNFKKHKEIRKKLKSAIKKGTLGLIDIGSSKIVCIIIKFSEISKNPKNFDQIDENNRIAYRVVGVATKKSVGIKKGEIIIAEEVEKTIRLVVQQSQKMAASIIDEVVITFSGGEPISKNLYKEIRTQNQTVSSEDINNLLSKYNFQIYPENREIMHAMPINFSLDEKTGLTDPRGLVGNILGLDINLVTIKKNVLETIHQCIQNCQLSLAGIFFSPYISAKSSLVEDELKLGAACIDMGAGTTGISIFYNHQLIFASNIRFGSENITSDIMQAFQLSFNEAERIKTLHGGLVVTNLDDNELIELSFSDANKEYYNYDRPFISRAELISVIRPRCEEIIEEIQFSLDKTGLEQLSSKRIVFTGGGSQLPGLYELASEYFGARIRIGRPMRVQGLPQALQGSQFSAIIGLAIEISNLQDEVWDFEIPTNLEPGQRLRSAVNWLKENW